MIIKIPTIERQLNDEGQIEKVRSEMNVQIDTSFLAHLKWEEQFQTAVGYDLTTYTYMVQSWLKDEKQSRANFVGLLKLLYCYVNSEKLPTFKDFVRLFDFEVADEILSKISVVLEEVNKSASKN